MKFRPKGRGSTFADTDTWGACYECGTKRLLSEFQHSEAATLRLKARKWWKVGQTIVTTPNRRFRCVPPPESCPPTVNTVSGDTGIIILEPALPRNPESKENKVVLDTALVEISKDDATPISIPDAPEEINNGTADQVVITPIVPTTIVPKTIVSKTIVSKTIVSKSFDTRPIPLPSPHTETIRCVTFSADGSQALSISADRAMCEWEPLTSRIKSRVDFAIDDTVIDAAVSRNKAFAAWATSSNKIELWSGRGTPINIYDVRSAISSLAFSFDSCYLAVGSDDGPVIVWDVNTNKPELELEGNGARPTSLAFAPGNKRLVSGTNKKIQLWDFQDGSLLQAFTPDDCTHSLAFSPDSARFASGSGSNVVLWSQRSLKPVRKFLQHTMRVEAVAFSPSGLYLASGSADCSVIIWAVTTGQCLQQLDGHTGGVTSVAFAPDNTMLVSGSADNSVRVWKMELGDEKGGALVSSIASGRKKCYMCLGYIHAVDPAERCLCIHRDPRLT